MAVWAREPRLPTTTLPLRCPPHLLLLLGLVLLLLARPTPVTALIDTSRTVSEVFSLRGDVYAFGDLNLDGKTDIVAYERNSKKILVYLGCKAGLETEGIELYHNKDSYRLLNVLVVDIAGRKQPDLLLSFEYSTKVSLVLVVIDTELNALSQKEIIDLGSALAEPTLLDVYGFDQPLLLMAKEGMPNQSLFYYSKDSKKLAERPMQADSATVCLSPKEHSNAFLDIGGDFKQELFVMCNHNEYQIFRPDPEGKKLSLIGNGYLPTDLASHLSFADIDGNGLVDVVFAVCETSEKKCNLRVLRGKDCIKTKNVCDKVEFAEPQTIFTFDVSDAPTSSLRLLVADWDMNGHTDFLFVSEGNVFIVMNVNPNAEDTKSRFKADAIVIKTASKEPEGQIKDIAIFDVYENGTPDLILVYHGGDGKVTTKIFSKLYKEDAFSLQACIMRKPCQKKDCPGIGLVSLGSSILVEIHSINTGVAKINAGEKSLMKVHQMTQSSSKSLQLPCAIAGLGRTNNFLPSIMVGGEEFQVQNFTEVIPNSILLFTNDGKVWTMTMLLQGSDHVAKVSISFGVVLVVIGLIAAVLQWQEKVADNRDRTYWI